jgi:ATP-dependent DNA helicase RecQ
LAIHQIREILQQYWGYDSFRPMQEDIIQSVLDGHDTLALLPTGGGKSICFQVPAMATDGLCLVISPLIALMKDQVENLRKRGIKAAAIHAGMNKQEVEQIFRIVRTGEVKFLYLAPERLQTNMFLDYLPDLNINLLAVDEAHCIVHWGYDFRPSYLQIGELRHLLPGVPILALTASATEEAQQDICKRLLFGAESRIYRKSFVRSNISYSTTLVESKMHKTEQILQRVPGTGIIYCRSRKRTEEIASILKQKGVSADFYHAGLDTPVRMAKQDEWKSGQTRIMVCTNAFGMGIDKPDVRLVIHFDCPESPEAYYQEAGRGGRDEEKAYAVLLYYPQDLAQLMTNLDLQYPTLQQLKEVYHAISSYLQIAIGDGRDSYFDFDMLQCAQNFSFNPILLLSALKVLEAEGYWELSESIYLPTRVCFGGDRELLEVVEKNFPELDELAKILLRTYPGIYNFHVSIWESQLARLAGRDTAWVTESLKKLHSLGAIDYIPAKDRPQLFFLHERIPPESLRVDMEHVRFRKEAQRKRITAMQDFVENRQHCRSRELVAYFGEQQTQDCGICDICVKNKQKVSQSDLMKEVWQYLKERWNKKDSFTFPEVIKDFSRYEQESVSAALRYLADEGRVTVAPDGTIHHNP